MHLLGPQFTTNNTRKRQVKHTQAQQKVWEKDWRAYNKDMKRYHQPAVTLEEYIDIVHGKAKRAVKRKELAAPASYRGADTHYRSIDPAQTNPNNTAAPARKEYTGTLVRGIATMHKSNAVPVIDEEQMKDISRMRRG